MTTSSSEPEAPKPPAVDPIKKVAIQLCVNITGAFQISVGNLIAKMQTDKGFRNTVLFSLTGKNEIGLACQPTPEVAKYIYDEVRSLLAIVLELERMEIADVLANSQEELSFADVATIIAERTGLPDMPSDPPPKPAVPKVVL